MPMAFTVGVIVVSDRAASGERLDACLPVFRRLLPQPTWNLCCAEIVPDDAAALERMLRQMIERKVQLVFTAGGTGCAPRDCTPEVTARLLERATPGIDETIRAFSLTKSPFAMYSRGCSGIAGQSLIINLPGSPRAVDEILRFLLPTLEHPLRLIAGQVNDCLEDLGTND